MTLTPVKIRRANYRLTCKNCIGGTVMTDADGRRFCLNCGAEHNENGELITKKVTGESPRYGRHFYWGKK